jgi:nitric oxide dioxygenase
MPLNAQVLENTFKLVEPRADEFAASFYQTLFTDCPAAEPLFADTDMEKQRKKLIMSLVYVVGNLRYPDNLTTKLKDLGAKHVTYGTMSVHYPIVGAALLKTLESYIGSAWTAEVKQAWTDAYEAIANIMVEGAREYELAQPPQAAQPETSQALAPQPVESVGSLKTLLIACGAMAILLGGIWFFTNQNKNSSPSPSSSIRFIKDINFGHIAP